MKKESKPSYQSESKWPKLIAKKAKIILYIFLVAAALIFAGIRVSSSHKINAEQDYYNALVDFNTLKTSTNDNDDAIVAELRDIVQRHPELHSKYDGAITQFLITAKINKGIMPFFSSGISKNALPFYNDYTKASLSIAEGKHQEALDTAIELKKSMRPNPSIPQQEKLGETLYAYNLLRIATLQRTLDNPEAEHIAWEELQRLATWNDTDSAYWEILNNFREEGVSLIDYIEMRQRQLGK